MKLFTEIPREKYNDVQWILDWLKENPEIGNENVEPIKYFHCFWKGQLSDLHLMCLDSLYKVHPNANVILWVSDFSQIQESYIRIQKSLKNKIEICQINKDHFKKANIEKLYSEYMGCVSDNSDQGGLAYASDIVRFIVLYIYGGLYFDMDVYFLRNFDSIKLKRYVAQWGTDMCGNSAIMRLEKGHDLIDKIIDKYNGPFYPTSSLRLDNDLDLIILPSTFFDILWRPKDQIPSHLQFNDCNDFFKIKELNLPEEIHAYHWHNRWNNPPPIFFKLN